MRTWELEDFSFCLYINQNDKVEYFINMVMNCPFWMLRAKQSAMHFLFFDYQIVGTFVCERENMKRTENITEALNIVKDYRFTSWLTIQMRKSHPLRPYFQVTQFKKYRELKETYKLLKIFSEKNMYKFACKKSYFVYKLQHWLRQVVLSESLFERTDFGNFHKFSFLGLKPPLTVRVNQVGD